jgi:uncharacterized protein YbjT (DUF2867 family)
MTAPGSRPRLLIVGGCGGLVGRALLAELSPTWTIRSIHRNPSSEESVAHVEWIRADVATYSDWSNALRDVELVINVAWYRTGTERRFRDLSAGLERLISAAASWEVPRFIQLSVPPAPEALEASLPYLTYKRRVDRALVTSGLSYAILRPTMLFGPRDKLLTVMLATMARYHRFPMFGSGEYHLSPLSVADLARLVRQEAREDGSRSRIVGGPVRWKYRALTDAMFGRLGLRPRYVNFSPQGSIRLARFLEAVGSTRLYAYEVEWLLADLLGVPPYEGLASPLEPVEPFLRAEAHRLRGARAPD